MSEARLCPCGKELSKFGGSRSSLCRRCRDQKEQDRLALKRNTKRLEKEQAASAAGLFLLHTCVERFDSVRQCGCRKLVDKETAMRLVNKSGCVDFETRQQVFAGRAILEIGKRKHPPVSTLGTRIASERNARCSDPAVDIDQLKSIVADERQWLNAEQRAKLEVEHELSVEAFRKITIVVEDQQWLRMRDEAERIPVMRLPVEFDQRTPNGIGIDIAPSYERAA